MLRSLQRRAELFRRLLAGGAAALVFALGVLAASPVLHHWLHGAEAAPAEDGCAVVLFASGVSVPLGALAVAPPAAEWREFAHAVAIEIDLVSPRYLRQPERGPPQVG